MKGYHVIVIQEAHATNFTTNDASSLLFHELFTNVTKGTGLNYTINLDENAKEMTGTPITGNTSYMIFVLTVADGINATENAMGDPSGVFTLQGTSSVSDSRNEDQLSVHQYGDQLHVDLSGFEQQQKTINLFNLSGQEVYRENV
ncbi:MAG: hypothetical protein IH946_04415, partial [Bacteroidetes bacterium]|nr:hypothetical protein [Bacteroidota bacterium]